MKLCINVRYFKSVSYGHGMIRLKGTLLGKRVNSDLIDMRTKERASFGLRLLLVFTGWDYLTRKNSK